MKRKAENGDRNKEREKGKLTMITSKTSKFSILANKWLQVRDQRQ